MPSVNINPYVSKNYSQASRSHLPGRELALLTAARLGYDEPHELSSSFRTAAFGSFPMPCVRHWRHRRLSNSVPGLSIALSCGSATAPIKTRRGFCQWLRAQDRDLSALNEEWQTIFRSWDEVRPFTTDQIQARMADNAVEHLICPGKHRSKRSGIAEAIARHKRESEVGAIPTLKRPSRTVSTRGRSTSSGRR